MDNYFFEEKLIVQIYDFFKQNSNRTSNHLTIYEFLEGKDGFLWTGEDGIGRMDVGMVKYISNICKKMESDGLLMPLNVKHQKILEIHIQQFMNVILIILKHSENRLKMVCMTASIRASLMFDFNI